jgi:hypothetical protein
MFIGKVISHVDESAVHDGAEEGFVFVERFAATLHGVELTRRFVELLPKLLCALSQLSALSDDASIDDVDLLSQGSRAHCGRAAAIMASVGMSQGEVDINIHTIAVGAGIWVTSYC